MTLVSVACVALIASQAHTALAAERFDFTKHCDTIDMASRLRMLLPRGTAKDVVEERLVKEGGATITLDDRPRSNPNIIHYFRTTYCNPEDTTWGINVTFDKNGRVWQIDGTGLPRLFREGPPEDRTDAGIFRFEDYADADDLAQTLHSLFPLGTPRSRVDTVLSHWGMAVSYAKVDEPLQEIYHYQFDLPATREGGISHSHHRAWSVVASYGNDKTLSELFVTGPAVVEVFDQTEWHAYFVPKLQAYQKQKRETRQ